VFIVFTRPKRFLIMSKFSVQRRYVITDLFEEPIRAFYTKDEALPYLTPQTKLIVLPKQLSGYKLAVTLVKGEATF
jgi:hypothetical protein